MKLCTGEVSQRATQHIPRWRIEDILSMGWEVIIQIS
jgi:NADH:ubiquinone oxidoreductase subunit H